MGKIRKKIKKIIFDRCPDYIAKELYDYKNSGFNNLSFSQEGEDLVLARFLDGKTSGFYVDVGAHHPMRFSNTYKFYLQGWKGINIDAMPNSMVLFNRIRPNDINLELAVSDKPETLIYYIFNEPALNTFSEQDAKLHDKVGSFRIVDKKRIEMHTLFEILDSHLPANTQIDFMSIDVEGLDLAVLKSNNWSKYRPIILLVESLRENLDQISKNNIYQYLKDIGYSLIAKTYNTMFFKDDRYEAK